MAPNEHQRAEALDRYWDARVRGETPSRTEGVDDFAAAVIAQLGEPVPPQHLAGAQQRVRQRILELATAATSTEAHVPVSARPISAVKLRINGAGASRTALLLAAAVLLALGMGLALTVFDIGRDDNRHAVGPAINAPATPSPEVTPGDTVLELTLPAGAVPTGEGVSAGLGYFSIPPGNSSTWIPNCCRGPLIEYVVSGQYTVTVAAAIEVIRANGTVERIPANTVVTLGPGDSLLSRNETEAQAVNNGLEPVEIVQWTLLDESGETGSFRGHLLPGWIDNGGADVQGPLQIQPLPTTIELRLVDAQDGDTIVPPPGGWLFVVGPDAFATDEHSDIRRVYGPVGQPIRAYFLTVTQPGMDSEATTTDAPHDDLLFQATLPVNDLPTTDRIRTVFYHLWIPPGTTTSGSSNCCSGPMIEYVITGSYTVRAAAAIQVIRANGAVEQVPANAGVTLGPGDSLISRIETAVQITVGGDGPAELLHWILVDLSSDPDTSDEHVPPEWIAKRGNMAIPLTTVPPYPLTVQIRRVVLPNGDYIAAPPDGTRRFVIPVGIAQSSKMSDGSTLVLRGDGGDWAAAYVLTMAQPGAPPGTPAP